MDIIDIFVIGIYVFTGIIVILSAILIFLYRNKKGLFDVINNNFYTTPTSADFVAGPEI